MSLSKARAFSTSAGSDCNAFTISTSCSFEILPFTLPIAVTNINNAANWVVNALVDATPTSTPARVMKARSDSRTKDELDTLQIVNAAM